MKKPACDTERLIGQISTGDKGKAWAAVEGIEQGAIPSYLRSLTSVVLRTDTRVTNHNFKNGTAVAYQAVLQAGTAVLVDSQGVPRVRCACGNPLLPPVLSSGKVSYTGQAWSGFQPSTLVVVTPAPAPVTEIVLVNVTTGTWFARQTGHPVTVDKPVAAPSEPLAPGVPAATSPAATASASSGSASASTSPSGSASASASGSSSPSSGSSSASSSASKPSSGSPSSGSSSSATKSSPPATTSPSASHASSSTASATGSSGSAGASSVGPATGTATATGTSTAASTATTASVEASDSTAPSPPPALTPVSVEF
ncbi:DUF6777 domain-containing protein [Kitasatospora sp. NPDC057015]|uniref:DUF6777 domain-containing protein n=1 Tax=Kitasatospora sp. NPDC057015 TaxID=3346001 RepID=UPI00363A110D